MAIPRTEPDARMSFNNDLVSAVATLRDVLRRHEMDVGRIVLMDQRDGTVIRYMLDTPYANVEPAMDPETGQPLRQVEVMGVLVQWPVKRIAMPKGFADI